MIPSKRLHSLSALVAAPALAALLLSSPALAQSKGEAKPVDKAKPVAQKAETKTPEAPPKTKIHVVALKGGYADQAGGGQSLESLLLGGGGGENKSVSDLLAQLGALAKDESADIVLFDFTKPMSIDGANLPRVAAAIHALRSKARASRTYAYLKNAGGGQFQLAAMCGRIYMAEMGTLDIPSPSLSTLHMKKAFDRFGIGMDHRALRRLQGRRRALPAAQDQRSPAQPLPRDARDDQRRIVERIAMGRDLDPKWVRAMQKKRIFTAKQAKSEGLIDALVPWRDAVPTPRLRARAGRGLRDPSTC